MKRIGIILLCICLCVGVVGCGEEAPQSAQGTTTTTTAATTTTIAAPSYLSDEALAAIVAPLLGMPDDGSIVGPIFASYQYNMQRDWALRLVTIYEQL